MTVIDNVVVPAASAIERVHRDLSRRPHLRPCADVNALFDELVGLVVRTPPGVSLPECGPRATSLRRLCAEGEVQLEGAWACRVAEADDPAACLASFPYLGNYRRLARLELDTLGRVATAPVRRVVFLGSGPLPLSALLLADALGVVVDAVDRDRPALDAGRRVAAALGADRVRFVHGDAGTVDVSGYDLVVLAALVGDSPAGKRAVLARLAADMAPDALLLARSARAARTLLYPPLDAADLAGFALQAVVHPAHEVINSIVIARALGAH